MAFDGCQVNLRIRSAENESIQMFVDGTERVSITMAAYAMLAWSSIRFGIFDDPRRSNEINSCMYSIYLSIVRICARVCLLSDALWSS